MVKSSTIKAPSKSEARYQIRMKYFDKKNLRIFSIKQISMNRFEVALSYNEELHLSESGIY